MRVLSGIQPTGRFHWGNYFGAIRQYIELQGSPADAFYFIANLHALTTVRDRGQLRQNTLDAAIDLLALGLDPVRATLFVQSDVPEVCQLCWLLMTGAPMGLLERCHAYKDKKARGLAADAGLFTYPVLMAADILAYDSDLVPVGEDQTQHIEVARDLAASFNHEFGETFVMPKAKVLDSSARAGRGRREDVQKLRQHARSVRGAEAIAEADHANCHRFAAHRTAERAGRRPSFSTLLVVCRRRAAGGDGRDLSAGRVRLRRSEEGPGRPGGGLFCRARERRRESLARPEKVREVLGDGAAARKKAAEVLLRAKKPAASGPRPHCCRDSHRLGFMFGWHWRLASVPRKHWRDASATQPGIWRKVPSPSWRGLIRLVPSPSGRGLIRFVPSPSGRGLG